MENSAYASLQSSAHRHSVTQELPPAQLVVSQSPRNFTQIGFYRHPHLVTSPEAPVQRPSTVLAPNSALINSSRVVRVERAGSRDKQARNSTQKISITSPRGRASNVTNITNITNTEIHEKRIVLLEQRVQMLEKEKAQIVGQFSERLNGLVAQNQRLVDLVKDLEEKGTQEEVTGEFNYQRMLEEQININLQLRKKLKQTQGEVEQARESAIPSEETIKEWEAKEQANQRANRDLGEQLEAYRHATRDWEQEKYVYEKQIDGLNETIAQMKEQERKREASIEQMIQEKEARILEAEEQVFTLEKFLMVKTAEMTEKKEGWQEMCEQLSALKMERLRLQEENEEMKKQLGVGSEESSRQKFLLKTIFRLKNQLNNKQQ